MTSLAPKIVTICLPPGPLGVAIQQSVDNGLCIVTSKSNDDSPLEVNDIIISLNGISLSEVEGGLPSWIKLFEAFASGSRALVVQHSVTKMEESMTGPSGESISQNAVDSSYAEFNTFLQTSTDSESHRGSPVMKSIQYYLLSKKWQVIIMIAI